MSFLRKTVQLFFVMLFCSETPILFACNQHHSTGHSSYKKSCSSEYASPSQKNSCSSKKDCFKSNCKTSCPQFKKCSKKKYCSSPCAKKCSVSKNSCHKKKGCPLWGIFFKTYRFLKNNQDHLQLSFDQLNKLFYIKMDVERIVLHQKKTSHLFVHDMKANFYAQHMDQQNIHNIIDQYLDVKEKNLNNFACLFETMKNVLSQEQWAMACAIWHKKGCHGSRSCSQKSSCS